ncbi:hypothetical protein BS47DRAFT_1360782 [Hydnum rufescens UP504]|uniref:Uncharacterized protein n=1 Tax=Hydnum rufescens UP504 TaxID=1448309 RepID=A0A9P6B1K4_9AGAM|nr:hypothetical protein BS47DRAFT_1360782 [Hydnum rufescens UP504]
MLDVMTNRHDSSNELPKAQGDMPKATSPTLAGNLNIEHVTALLQVAITDAISPNPSSALLNLIPALELYHSQAPPLQILPATVSLPLNIKTATEFAAAYGSILPQCHQSKREQCSNINAYGAGERSGKKAKLDA